MSDRSPAAGVLAGIDALAERWRGERQDRFQRRLTAAAESVLGDVCRAVGGGAFSSSSPFATWNEDVRALGYLRPPWGLAFDQLIAARQPVQ